jgi:hypothetical protein
MQIRVTYLTDGEIEFYNERRSQQLAHEANYTVVLGLFLEGLAEEPDREEYGISAERHAQLLRMVS